MADGYQETKGAVLIFLRELKYLLSDNSTKLDIKLREDKELEYTTGYCLRTLLYDENDVKKELMQLKIEDYVETCDDKIDIKSNKYYVFSKTINKRNVYIKVKIVSYNNKKVLCMSFHFAEFKMKRFPFK